MGYAGAESQVQLHSYPQPEFRFVTLWCCTIVTSFRETVSSGWRRSRGCAPLPKAFRFEQLFWINGNYNPNSAGLLGESLSGRTLNTAL